MTYKCSVHTCRNIVPKNGVMCPICLSKYLDDRYYIVTCAECKDIVEFRNNKESIPDDKRVIFTKCRFCITKENMRRFLESDDNEYDDDDL